MTVLNEVPGRPDPFDASGCFETCRVRAGRALRLEEHLSRLRASMRTLGMEPLDDREARAQVAQAARGLIDGSVRLAVRRSGRAPRLLVHRHEGLPYPARFVREGVSVRTAATRWPAGESTVAQVKASERLAGVLARIEVPETPEVLRIGPHGYLTEGTVSNLFIVSGGALITPPSWLGVLAGVTRAHVLAEGRRSRMRVEEIPFTRHELFNAEEAFLTNVLMPVLPVREADGRRIGSQVPGPVTRRMMKALS